MYLLLQAHYKFSLDAVNWTTSPRQTYSYTVRFSDGGRKTLLRVERPQLHFATQDPATGKFSNATTLYNAVCEEARCVVGGQTGRTHTWARVLKADDDTAAAGKTVYEWIGPPATPTGEANSPLPSGPLLGNGDLGLSVVQQGADGGDAVPRSQSSLAAERVPALERQLG